MQTNGIGSSSHSDMHHVTTCIHNHKHRLEGKVGSAGGAGTTPIATPTVPTTTTQSGEIFSLSAWLQNTLSGAKGLLGRIWGSDTDAVQGEVVARAGTEVVADIVTQDVVEVTESVLDIQSGLQHNMQQNAQQELHESQDTKVLHIAQIEAASVTVQSPRNFNNNPYFAAIQDNENPQQTIWQKIKVRFQNITGFLAKKFSFAGGGTFQTKQERPKEDLRRHSRYRKDDVEIDCVITDESYLMDSYNKKGEYSKLSTGK